MSIWVNKLAVPPTTKGSVNLKTAEIDEIKINNFNSTYRNYKGLIRAATTTAVVLSGTKTIDGVPLVEGDLVLVKNQLDGINNGIYKVSQNNWIRSKLLENNTDASGILILIEEGNVNSSKLWGCNSDIGTVGKNILNFINLSGSGGGGPTDPYKLILKKESDENIQWRITIEENNLIFSYSLNNGVSFETKYTFSPN